MGRLEGLFVGGTVRDRRRRYINKAGCDQVKIVTYTLTDSNDRDFYVEDYAPSSYRNIGGSKRCSRLYQTVSEKQWSAFIHDLYQEGL